METSALHYTAFAHAPHGGNPAGVVLDAAGLGTDEMQAIAAGLGYPESAFVVSAAAPADASGSPDGAAHLGMRYFSPGAEIPFCGHATVATAVALFETHGWTSMVFDTRAGEVAISAGRDEAGAARVAFVSVPPRTRDIAPAALAELFEILGLEGADIDPDFPVLESFAGNWHPVLVLRDRDVFHQFRFDPVRLRTLMEASGWTGTVTVLSRLDAARYEARNLFPVGRITEDPATGSAAASTGAYLRAVGRAPEDGHVEILQGSHVGRPSLLLVDIPAEGGITVSGGATRFTPAG